MMRKTQGQSAIIFALVLVGVLGFVGIAIDGGMALTQDSQAQAVTDTISLTAAQSLIENSFNKTTAINDALALANTEGFDNNGTDNTVSINITGPFTENSATVYYVDSAISSDIDTTFSQLFTANTMQQSSNTQVRVQIISNTGPMFDGYGIIATDGTVNTPLTVVGGATLYTGGGGIYSANDVKLTGGIHVHSKGGPIYIEGDFTVSGGSYFDSEGGDVIVQGEFDFSGNSNSYLDGGSLYVQGDIDNYAGNIYGGASGGQMYTNGNLGLTWSGKIYEMNYIQAAGQVTTPSQWFIIPDYVQWATPLGGMPPVIIPDSAPAIPILPTPDCSGMPNYGSFNGNYQTNTIHPGNYTKIQQGAGGTLIMNPGIYCVSGDIKFNGGSTVIADGVFFYISNGGGFHVTAGANLGHSAPTNLTDASGNEWGGMAMFLDPNSNTSLNMNGGSTSYYSGTFYGPNSKCDWEGGVSPVFNKAQLVCGTIKFSGGTTIDFDYDGDIVYQGGSGTPVISLEIID